MAMSVFQTPPQRALHAPHGTAVLTTQWPIFSPCYCCACRDCSRLLSVCVDEIALEGPDGITLPQLWERVNARFRFERDGTFGDVREVAGRVTMVRLCAQLAHCCACKSWCALQFATLVGAVDVSWKKRTPAWART